MSNLFNYIQNKNKNMKLLEKSNGNLARTPEEIEQMIENASEAYAQFLTAVGFDYKADRQTVDTPRRVAKAWLKDLIVGSVTDEPNITVFPNDEGYDGLVIQSGIPIVSMCAHHNLAFTGFATVAYVPAENVIGLSKLNRIVEWFGRRPQMQESLTTQIHDYVADKMQCESVAVSIACKHTCCSHRGIKHGSVMTTNKFSGVFMEKDNLIREEFLHAIEVNGAKF
jgi:GTP cyclohydrolase I